MSPDLEAKFDKWAPEMERLLAKEGLYGIDDIRQGWREGRYQVWFSDKCFTVCEVLRYPRKKVGFCFMAAGDAEELARMTDFLEEFYRGYGCSRSTFTGRKGWERHDLTKSRGYEVTGTMYTKEL